MKINPIAGLSAINSYKTQRAKSPEQSFSSAMDQVSLSEEVVSFSSTISKIKEQMDVRSPEELAHIEEISRLIHSGNYHIPGEKVAAKIVDDYLG